MRNHIVAGVLILMVTGAVGCESYSSPATVVHWDNGSAGPRMTTAKASGQYALHSMNESRTKMLVYVEKGERLGFEPAGDMVVARAGTFQTQLPRGTYYWSRRS